VNTTETPAAVKKKLGVDNETWVVDATGMAMRIMGINLTNTAVLGAVVKASGAVKLDSVLAVVKERFQGKVKDQNLEVVEAAYKEAIKG
jgi:Pyruvate/2-oxoacid:ferredoxin oxidoreductase gamma subunit